MNWLKTRVKDSQFVLGQVSLPLFLRGKKANKGIRLMQIFGMKGIKEREGSSIIG